MGKISIKAVSDKAVRGKAVSEETVNDKTASQEAVSAPSAQAGQQVSSLRCMPGLNPLFPKMVYSLGESPGLLPGRGIRKRFPVSGSSSKTASRVEAVLGEGFLGMKAF
jgi:hypothetical protein